MSFKVYEGEDLTEWFHHFGFSEQLKEYLVNEVAIKSLLDVAIIFTDEATLKALEIAVPRLEYLKFVQSRLQTRVFGYLPSLSDERVLKRIHLKHEQLRDWFTSNNLPVNLCNALIDQGIDSLNDLAFVSDPDVGRKAYPDLTISEENRFLTKMVELQTSSSNSQFETKLLIEERRKSRMVRVEPHRFAGVFVSRGREDCLVTLNLTPGKDVLGEKLLQVEGEEITSDGYPKILEYRVWNPFRSKLAATILGGIEHIHMRPGGKVLYLGAACGLTLSHISDIVGSDGIVYAVDLPANASELMTVARERSNVIPILEDPNQPYTYKLLVSQVETIYCDYSGPNQVNILQANAQHFMPNGGKALLVVSAEAISATGAPEQIFHQEVQKLRQARFKPREQLTLEPFERAHAVIVSEYIKPPE